MSTTQAVADAIRDAFPMRPFGRALALASASSGVPLETIIDGLTGWRRFTLTELHRLAIATGRRVVDFYPSAVGR